MDKLNALKYFCTAADTLQFRETAQRLSVSPQVVTRVIAELEDYLGEALFVRNTRNVQLTDFGARFLPEAQQLLADSERLFTAARTRTPADEMRGTVRVTLPFLPENDAIIAALFARCAEYPDLQPDWRVNAGRPPTSTISSRAIPPAARSISTPAAPGAGRSVTRCRSCRKIRASSAMTFIANWRRCRRVLSVPLSVIAIAGHTSPPGGWWNSCPSWNATAGRSFSTVRNAASPARVSLLFSTG